jgi:hypothetical protein
MGVAKLVVGCQARLHGPWIETPPVDLEGWESPPLPKFKTATPVGYRVMAETEAGATTELWGYFQVR